MAHERALGSQHFDTRRMSVLLEGGDEERLKRKERFMVEVSLPRVGADVSEGRTRCARERKVSGRKRSAFK